MPQADDALQRGLLDQISARLDEQQYRIWFTKARFRYSGPNRVEVLVQNRFQLTFMKHRFLSVITEAVENYTRWPEPRIEFRVDPDQADDDASAAEGPSQSGVSLGAGAARVVVGGSPPPSERGGRGLPGAGVDSGMPDMIPLNPEYTFDQFVTGPSNRLAQAAAYSVANNPGTAYNPLFIYGSVGLGKTHLMQAVAHVLLANGIKNLVYLSCASFTNDFIASLERTDIENFRRKYRHAGALLIDDIQFLANKERTQEEFFHTFNAIYNEQKQIFLSSDCLPSEIAGLGERLVSRFKLGLVAQLSPPSFETRIAILMRKGRNLGLDIGPDIAEYVAQRLCDNVREIEGALLRIHSLVTIEKRSLTLANIRDSLSDLLGHDDRRIDLQRIQEAVLEQFDVDASDIHSKRRSRSIVVPRQICMYLARRHTEMSLGEIGAYFGGRDHTTVMHAIDKIGKVVETDANVRKRLDRIEASLRR